MVNDPRSEQKTEVRLNSLVFVAIYTAVAIMGVLLILFVAANLPTVIYWLLVIMVAVAAFMILLSILSLFIAIPLFVSKGAEAQEGDYDMDDQEHP